VNNTKQTNLVSRFLDILSEAEHSDIFLTELFHEAIARNDNLSNVLAEVVFQDPEALESINMLVDESGGAMVVGSATSEPDLLLINIIHLLDCLEEQYEHGDEDEDLKALSLEYGLEYHRYPEDSGDSVPDYNFVTVFDAMIGSDAQSLVSKCGKLGAIRQILDCNEQ
jgi:hypothetical protein